MSRGRRLARVGSVLLTVCASACASQVAPAASQLGQATITAASAENALFDAVEQKHSDAVSTYLLTSRYLETDANGNVRPKGGSAAAGRAISAPVRQAITGLLNALRAYGEALQSLAGDAAASTFDANADSLAKSAANLDTSLLRPLGGQGLPAGTRLNAVGQAVKDVGNAVITFLAAKDVQTAARNVQAPLRDIVGGLKSINLFWTKTIPANASFVTTLAVVSEWNSTQHSIADREELQRILNKAAVPLTPDDADKALDALVAANGKLAMSGPTVSYADIQKAVQAAQDAVRTYEPLVR